MKAKLLILSVSLFFSGITMASGDLNENAHSSLLTDITLDGKSSVIVEYENLIGQGSALESAQGEARIPIIGTMHQAFKGSLPENLSEAVTDSFSYVPGSVMSVTPEQLKTVRDHPMVKQVYPNRARRASLEESIDLVLPGKSKERFSGKGQTVVIIDTGVDRGHSFFEVDGASRMIDGACYSGGGFTNFREAVTLCPNRSITQFGAAAGIDCTALSFPGCDHGTHVAGIAAGNDGVANEANIIGMQVFTGLRDVFRRNLCGLGVGVDCVVAFDSDILKALERVYALRNTYDIASVNMSLGGGRFRSTCDGENPMVTNVVNRLKSAGIATVSSSGNNGFTTQIGWPSCISNIVAVGATSDFTGSIGSRAFTLDERAFYSNSSATLDLYAPGTLIRSSVPGNRFANFNGTSMASPHVAGAFAVVKSRKNSLSVSDIETVLKSTGPLVSQSGISRRRIDIAEALKELGLLAPPITPIIVPYLLED